jgi:putative hemolysin
MIELLVIALCLFLNAIFSCIEMAFVTVSRPHLKQLASKGSTAAMRVLLLKRNPERVLSVLQIGITLVGAISAAVGGAGAQDYFGPRLMDVFDVSINTAELLAVALVVLPLTFISVVIGELVPKSLALRFPLKFALAGGVVLGFMDRLFSPFVYLLEISTKFFTQFVFSKVKGEVSPDTSREIDLDPLTESHKQYVFNLIEIDKRKIEDIMVPWEEVQTVDISEHHFTVLEKIRTCRHTRLPVMQNGAVIGLIHTKEFVSEAEITKLDWTELIRPILKMNSKEPLLNALKTLQKEKTHLALAIRNEQPIGIITTEDIFEEVVGEIFDEDDNPRTLLSSNSKIRKMKLKQVKVQS